MFSRVLFGFLLLAALPARAEALPEACGPKLAGVGAPVTAEARDLTGLCRDGYALAHDDRLRVPLWVVQRLTPERLAGTADRREQRDPFAADPDLSEEARATLADYRNSGYDRGHMAPAADMKASAEAMRQSFYLSNMAPQVGPDMNRGIWARLEEAVRDWACDRGELVVLTGPVFESRPVRTLGGKGRVAIPDAFWKLAYDPARREAVAFVLPNAPVPLQGRPARTVLGGHMLTIDALEARTGLDLLPALEDGLEATVEASAPALWPKGPGCRKALPAQVAEG
ncbi:MAG TPA: DNA/RNA non-specific endonuclease [Azospirillaceae bacterium]|nr:DNA/RNA non-specific endonuclease [Azospirillaceae bacterium]